MKSVVKKVFNTKGRLLRRNKKFVKVSRQLHQFSLTEEDYFSKAKRRSGYL